MKRTNIAPGIYQLIRPLFLLWAITLCVPAIAQPDSVVTGQNFKVSGVVHDANTGQPVAAAQISTFNSQTSATTNNEGEFTIDIVTKNEVLIINAFEYNQGEIPVQGRDKLEVDLYPKIFSDSYKLVESIAGKIKRTSQTTAAIRQIDEINDLYDASIDGTIQKQLGGNVRTINRSGMPGTGAAYFIRGFNSLNRNAQPLFVVDGVIWKNHYDAPSLHNGFFNNTLAMLDLNDIESVTVLKDGTSIYGSKGGNGVILINTVRGKDKATKITVNALGGVSESSNSLPMMGLDQFKIYATELMGTTELYANNIGNYYFVQDDPTNPAYPRFHNNTNWDDEVYRTGKVQSMNINVSGGDDKALYNFSLGYFGQTGIIKTTDMNRLNTRFNADFSLHNNFNMGLNIGFSNIDRTMLNDGVDFYTSPTYQAMIKAPFLHPNTYTVSGTLTKNFEDSDLFNVGNPSAIIANSLNLNKNNRLNIGLKPVYKITPELTLSSMFDYSIDKVQETFYKPMVGAADQYIEGYGISENMFIGQVMRDITVFDDTRISYTKNYTSGHHVGAMLGWRFLSTFYEMDYGVGHNTGSDQKRNLMGEMEFKDADGLNNRIRSISNYINIDYNYQGRYYATVAMALDGSSRFGRQTEGGFQLFGQSWGFFPSLNTAWLASSEDFMSGIHFINRLKVRASYGLSGNDDILPYAWVSYLSSERYMGRANALVIDNLGNDKVQWETTAKLNFGVDASLFNNRMDLTFDVYNNQTSNLLSMLEAPMLVGDKYYLGNSGSLQNTGFEVNTSIKVLNRKNLKWEVSASAGHYTNQMMDLPQGSYTTSVLNAEIITSKGNPAGLFYGYKSLGVFVTQDEASNANLKIVDRAGNDTYFTAGDVHFEDLNNDNIINEEDKQVIGDPNPDIYGSFSSMLAYKNFSLDAYFTYSYGNEVYNYLRSQLESGGGSVEGTIMNQTTAMLTRWSYEGHVTNQPKAMYADPMGNARFSDRWIEDGSYLKFKSLTLNYKVDLKTSIISGLTVSLSANNLFTFSNYLGRDPEVSPYNSVLFQGIDTGLIPSTRGYFIGIKMNL
ncbi:SusC/RagA family TonB-linked outer membrane protein [Roseimarinus sediminis]|uniref:SusC/RagA family TonB-linked outer membrane protein n=1 Tax=Roseimarinus sediminis TaxID=1610899 RepID=UPI003D1B9F80